MIEPGTKSLEERLTIAPELRRRHGGYSFCGRCGLPWPACRSHSTDIGNGSGVFPLCEDCWTELQTPEARLPFYQALINWWGEMAPARPEEETAIIAAVMAGK